MKRTVWTCGTIAFMACWGCSSQDVASEPTPSPATVVVAEPAALPVVAAPPPDPEPEPETVAEITAAAPAPTAPDPDAYRPAWWDQAGERCVVTFADDTDLRAATRRAAREGFDRLRVMLGQEPDRPITRTESVQRPDGTYRAFFLAAARPNTPG